MAFRKVSRRELLSSCSEPGPDDGLDPRFDRREGSDKVPNRKALQLCAQAARTLASVLAGECGDEILRDLVVTSVVPAPNTSRLLVSVAPSVAVNPGRLLERLQSARGKLRMEVAAAINRRRAPDLVFRIVEANRVLRVPLAESD
jgi:ribosome-binding factor A